MHKKQIAGPEVLRQRQERHRRLMKMIKNYSRSEEETKRLERIKNNTVMEINLRFLKSEHNRYYRFPKFATDDSSEQEKNTPFAKKQQIIYDLRTQNQIPPKQIKKNVISLEGSRRIKSLEREKTDLQQHRLGRLHQLKERQLSYKKIRKNSLTTQKKIASHVKLPELKKKQKLKTQSKNDSVEIDRVIGKKLITEISTDAKEGVHKFIKNRQDKTAKKKVPNTFLQGKIE